MGGGSSQPAVQEVDDKPFVPFYCPSTQLPPDILPFSHRNISTIEVNADSLINRTSFIFSDGTSKHNGGDASGNNQISFHLAPNEHLTKVYWRQSSQLCGIQFETNLNRKSIPYLLTKQAVEWQNANTGPGRYWVHTASPGHKIIGYTNRMLPGKFNCPCKYELFWYMYSLHIYMRFN